MSQAISIVEEIMKIEDNYEEWGLSFPEKIRGWKAFNILVGENGAGKSRVLQLIRDKASKECIVFHLDFANYRRNIYEREEPLENKSGNNLIDRLVFNTQTDNKIYLNFLTALSRQILPMFNELLCMKNNESARVRKRAQSILNDLNPSVREILHREIRIEEDGVYLCKGHREVTIENEWELLSPGEWSILLIIFAVLLIKLESKPCILLIDELETHLHPDAQVKLYELLKQNLQASEVDHCTCIASHSIFLLPYFDISELVYMHNGQIGQINGGLYQQIYDNLTGESGKKAGSLSDFLYSVSAWQYADYLTQCFLEPTTVDRATSTDEQALQLVHVLKILYEHKEKISILDFGAGSGRIGKCIELMLKDNDDVLSMIHKLKYNIYDKKGVSCNLQENTGWMGRSYVSEEDIISSGAKFDLILLYNVLHEIGVDEWVKELRFIFSLLSEEGMLLFGEREILSIGERPYGKSGYLVLGKDELSILFPDSEIIEIFLPQEQKTSTICFAIKKPPKLNHSYPIKDNVKKALRSLKDNTKSKIRKRNENGLGEKSQSRKYAFYCQQYVNAEEAIELLNLKKENPSNMLEHFCGIASNRGDIIVKEIKVSNLSPQEKKERLEELGQKDIDVT